MGLSSAASRRKRAVESFRTAAECIGPIEQGMSVFAITRGQFSMIDAIVHVIESVGLCRVSLWTWTIADYEIDVVNWLQENGKIQEALLLIDRRSQSINHQLIQKWKSKYGDKSVKYIVNHAKIATVESLDGRFRVLLRGSMNLNHNARFEQLDVTEGGPDFDLVRRIEGEIKWLPDDFTRAEVTRVSCVDVSKDFGGDSLKPLQGLKKWQI